MASFNLTDQAWIPVINSDGTNSRLSLLELFDKAQEIREIYCDSPLETISLNRFLQVLLIRIYQVNDEDNWLDIWDAGKFDLEPAKAYFEKWYSRFDIFDKERPFYQRVLTSDEKKKTFPFARLSFEPGVGTQRTLYNHLYDEKVYSISISNIPIKLITAQAFLTGAGSGFTDANLTEGMNFWINEKELFKSLLLNTPYDLDILENIKNDECSWERKLSKIKKTRPVKGILDYLTWQSRTLYIELKDTNKYFNTDSVVKTSDFNLYFDKGEKALPQLDDPLMVLQKKKVKDPITKVVKKELKPKLFDKNKAFWRDSNLLYEAFGGDGGTARNIEFVAANDLCSYDKPITLEIYGVRKGKNPGSKDLMKKESMPFYPKIFRQNLQDRINDFLTIANTISIRLGNAIKSLGSVLLYPSKDNYESLSSYEKDDVKKFENTLNIEQNYWAFLENIFYKFLEDIAYKKFNTTEEFQKFKKDTAYEIFKIAKTSFSNSTNNFDSSAKHLRAITIANRKLYPINFNGENYV